MKTINITEGSEKQINWANSIQKETIEFLEMRLNRSIEKSRPEYIEKFQRRISFIENNSKTIDASWWINNRYYLTSFASDVVEELLNR